MTFTPRALLISAAIGMALTACKAGDSVAQKTASITLPSGITKIETIPPAKGDQVVIPYTKYKLDNGLTVVLHEDKSDPLVHVDVTYHVGSGREEPGRSGFAHFF